MPCEREALILISKSNPQIHEARGGHRQFIQNDSHKSQWRVGQLTKNKRTLPVLKPI